MQADGSIVIDTLIRTKDANAQLRTLQNSLVRLSKTKNGKSRSAASGIGEGADETSAKIAEIDAQLKALGDREKELLNRWAELNELEMPTEEFTEVQNQIDETEKKINTLMEKMEKWKASGKSTKSTTFKGMQYELDELTKTLEYARAEKEDLIEEGRDIIYGTDTKEYAQIDTELDEINEKMKALREERQRLSENTGFERVSEDADKAKESLNSLCTQYVKAKKSNDSLTSGFEKLGKRIAGLAKRVFVFSLITKAFRAMVSGIQDGLKNFAQYSQEYNDTMSKFSSASATLKNALATAVAPILNLLIPALTKVCGWLTTVANLVSKFAAFISGKSTWTRAKQQQINYAKSLQSTASAADKAKSSLAGFDDLDVLQQDTSTGTGTSGGETTGAGAFEEVPLTDSDISLLEKVKGILEAILPVAVAIGAAFVLWKIANFVADLVKIWPILSKILLILLVIGGTIVAISGYLDMWNEGVDWDGLKKYLLGVAAGFIGILVLLGPVAAGIYLLIASVAGFILAIKDMSENGLTAQNVVLLLASAVGIVIAAFILFGSGVALVVAVVVGLITIFVLAMAKMGKLEEFVGYLKNAFAALGTFLKSVFVGDWKTAFRAIGVFFGNIANAIIVAFESMVNLIIDGLNWLIKKANNLVNKVPGVDVQFNEIDHKSFKRISVPSLANGGITTGSTLARIGEAGREAVLPLENNLDYLDTFAQKIADAIPSANTGAVYLQVDGVTFARLMNPYNAKENQRIGVSFLKG